MTKLVLLFIKKITGLNKYIRKIILNIIDLFLLNLSFILSLWITNFNFVNTGKDLWIFLFFISFITLIINNLTKQYDNLTKYIGVASLYISGLRNIFLIFIVSIFSNSTNVIYLDIKALIVLFFLFNYSTITIRLILRDFLLKYSSDSQKNIKKLEIVVYGAGSAGAQLAASLRNSKKFNIYTFVDDNELLWGRSLYGIPINSKFKIFNQNKIPDLVLLAIPSAKKSEKRKIVNFVNSKRLPIMQIPTIEQIANGQATIDNIQPIDLEDLLTRESKLSFSEETFQNIEGNSILITGAGGSIGSELSRMILKLNPSKLVLLDLNESNLYHIDQELTNLKKNRVMIYAFLGNALNKKLLKELFIKFKTNIVFHAAAYKHVPLVEENVIEGVLNNVFSTKIVCETALESDVNQVVMISTDKAVRPTNVMGASKRLSELVVKAYSEISNKKTLKSKTRFSMVRFGNVLGSSGSVVPLFKKQISEGGPITLTHKDVVRYFMTISEAAKLVIEAATLSEGGELFLLDMGKPVKIKNMAEQLIRLSGLRVKNKKNPNGDIEIVIKGLRKGEKLFEELLIDPESEITKNPLIYKAKERNRLNDDFFDFLNRLQVALENREEENCISLLKSYISEWEISKR